MAKEIKIIEGQEVEVEVGNIGEALKNLSQTDGLSLHKINMARQSVKWLRKELNFNLNIIKTEAQLISQGLNYVSESE